MTRFILAALFAGLMTVGATVVNAAGVTFEIRMGDGDLESCVDYVAAFNGPIAGILRNAGEAATPAIIETLRVAMEPYHTGKYLELAASPWIVSARRT